MQPKKNCCMTFWGGWKNSLIFLNNLSVDLMKGMMLIATKISVEQFQEQRVRGWDLELASGGLS